MSETVGMPAEVYDQLEAHTKAVAEAQAALTEFKATCLAHAPAATGDIVTVTNHTHQGKQMMVSSVHLVQGWNGEWRWKVVGKVLKKDCIVGLQHGESRYNIQRSE